ncbi:MAG TPA: HEPN domain-containing protein [Granulicella sp.]|jgi:HEPN domain-containing protein
MPIDPQAELLLQKSAEDRVCLNFPLPSASFGFHASQAVEKLLKALIAARGEVFPFTHKLATLDDQLRDAGEIAPTLACGYPELQPHAVLTRYDEAKELDDADRKRFIETVDVLRQWVEARIAVLSA